MVRDRTTADGRRSRGSFKGARAYDGPETAMPLAHPSSTAWALAIATMTAGSVSAQYRPTDHVPDLSPSALSQLVSAQQSAVSSCAAGEETGSFLAEVRARVAPGPAPSTLFNARIAVTVRSRPRDHELERCVRRRIEDDLRHQRYAVTGRAMTARHTFHIGERPEPPEERPAPPFSEAEVRHVLRASQRSLERCLEVAGLPEGIELRLAVEADGRLTLMNANLPPGVPPRALGCLAETVSRLRIQARPRRRVPITYTLGVRG